MKRALLVIDVQNGFLKMKDFSKTWNNINLIIDHFNKKKDFVISFQHIDDEKTSLIQKGTPDGEIEKTIVQRSDYILQKKTPNAFLGTSLDEILKRHNIQEVVIIGFNSEYCCLFTPIAANDRGYSTIMIEDATNTVNEGENYGIEKIDIPDFISTILAWSDLIKVKTTEEFFDISSMSQR